MQRKTQVAKFKQRKVVRIELDATFFFERAIQSLDRLNYDKALKYFGRAVEYEPDNPVNYCNMAGVLSETGNYEQSNDILQQILDDIDPSMTECYFYMANNYANMELFTEAEESIVRYLELDPVGQFLDETEELLDFLSFELERPTRIRNIKSREGLFEHDKARNLLETGKFADAVRVLERLAKKHPDFTAAQNNLALAYYYMGQFDKSLQVILRVLEQEEGNIHALCNLAILYQHFAEWNKLEALTAQLSKTYPYHQEHVFKLATTMGILGEHQAAYRHFQRLLRAEEVVPDPYLYHYAAVAACNIGRFSQAESLWKRAGKLDQDSDVPRFYSNKLDEIQHMYSHVKLSYHYQLPFEEQLRLSDNIGIQHANPMDWDPLIRLSLYWALQFGVCDTKLQVLQMIGTDIDEETEKVLRAFVMDETEDDYLKKVAVFVLRNYGSKKPLNAVINGAKAPITTPLYSPQLPVWEQKWKDVMQISLENMDVRYDLLQQHDLQTLWVEFLTRSSPIVPKIIKAEGWAAGLEYLTAKMHWRVISYQEVALRYGVSITTVRKNVKMIDEVCGLRDKMNAMFPRFDK